jgi:folate-binding protein YgfZ
MSNLRYIIAGKRGLLQITGEDAQDFLQGMISNDMDQVSAEKSVYAALLTPQGKFLFDFVVLRDLARTGYLLDCDADRLPDLQRRLSMYKLRADVTLEDVSETLGVALCYGDGLTGGEPAGQTSTWGKGVKLVDPRLAGLGLRVVLPCDGMADFLEAEGYVAASEDDWEAHRLALGVPEAGRDILIEKSFPLECSFDELGAISYTKGCYVGQELTARTHHRATLRKRLLPVHIKGQVPANGTPIMFNDREVGEMRSGQGDHGMALIRLEYLSSLKADVQPDDIFEADGTSIRPWIPDWVEIKPLDKE